MYPAADSLTYMPTTLRSTLPLTTWLIAKLHYTPQNMHLFTVLLLGLGAAWFIIQMPPLAMENRSTAQLPVK